MAATEEVLCRKQQQQQMGEDSGVARFGAAVVLESDTAARGRRCSNSTCLAVEGVGVAAFKRCGSCRQRFYCSAHCQRTDWPKGHSKECPALKAAAASVDAGGMPVASQQATTNQLEATMATAAAARMAVS
uniref:MYND-type domain-containing protein n=1 Tax=Tetradesmus obliquus TaxID=3088 RepID=A0A383V8E7_TETOB|eukprot:jgi/Sobl393_1/3308/SZX61838.1